MKNKRVTIYEALQVEAISDILAQNDLFFHRKVCRWYSKTFHTPLHQVINGEVMLWDEILLHYYESQMEEVSYNDLFDLAVNEYVPELAEVLEEENQEFADSLLEEQKRTIAKQKTRLAARKQKVTENDINTIKKFSNIKDLSSEIEFNDGLDDKIKPSEMKLNFDDDDLEEE